MRMPAAPMTGRRYLPFFVGVPRGTSANAWWRITMFARVASLALYACVFAIGLSGCSKDPAAKLIGTWTLDLEAFKASDDFKKMGDAEKKMAEGLMKNMKLDIEFTKDKVKMSTEMMGKKDSKESPYKITKTEGNKITIETTEDGKTESVDVVFDGDRVIMGKGKEKFYLKKK